MIGLGLNRQKRNRAFLLREITIPTFQIVPHKEAKLFQNENPQLLIEQAVSEISSENMGSGEGVRQILRQTGIVNLWFFAKFIVGAAAEFDRLNADLHMDMCNFRQRLLKPGARGAMFIPRSHCKTKIVTEAGGAWEGLRNPNISVRISNQIADKASEFLRTIKGIFDSNEFLAWLYPEWVPKANQRRWNETELVLPNRTKNQREASWSSGGASGASEGGHFDLHIVDDMIGLNMLNAGRQSSADMTRTRNWFWGSEKTLLNSMKHSRVIVVGTRYAVDDVYDDILKKTRIVHGFPIQDFRPNPKGLWEVYYRKAIEHNKIIFPETVTKESLEELAETDWWTYVTQYLNDPQASDLAELNKYKVKKCRIEQDDFVGFKIIYGNEFGETVVPLKNCDVLIVADPAATEKYVSSKTSRSAVGVLATYHDRRKFFLRVKADYVESTKLIDWLFERGEYFKHYVRRTCLEAQGAFKLLGPIIRDRVNRERKWGLLNLNPVTATGDKIARIRTAMQPELEMGTIYVEEDAYLTVMEEIKSFPQSARMDVLDMMTIGLRNCIVPNGPEQEEEYLLEQEEWYNRDTTNVTGY